LAQDAARKLHKQAGPTSVLRGFIDGVRPSGFIEGWAYDKNCAWKPLEVMVRVENAWIASGLAYHFRDDLLAEGVGSGWCGFTLRTDANPSDLRGATLFLVERGGVAFLKRERLPFLPDIASDLRDVNDIVAADPTMARSVEQLRGCETLFARFVITRGVEAFVRTAYVYILGRPADEQGLKLYATRIRRGLSPPFELLQILAASEEYLLRRPALVAPTQPSFPFLVD
jgi:hypothetical protein